MATKYINAQHNETGVTLYARIKNEAGGWYDPGDGTFKAFAVGNVVSLTEDANAKYTYAWSGGTAAVWPDGRYYVYAFKQIGGSPHATNDVALGIGIIHIDNDAEVLFEDMRGTDGANTITPPTVVQNRQEMDSNSTQLSTIVDNLVRALGLSYENAYQHTRTYSSGKLASAKLDLYNSKANAQTHDGTTGIVAKYTLTFTYSANELATMLSVQDS